MARGGGIFDGLSWEEVPASTPGGAGYPASEAPPVEAAAAAAGTPGAREGRPDAEPLQGPPVPPGLGRPHPDRARQFMPFAALRGYYDLVHEKEHIEQPRRHLTEEEARSLDDTVAQLVRGDVVACDYYRDGAYRRSTGVVSQIDLIYRTLWIVREAIPFDEIAALERLAGPGGARQPGDRLP